MTLTHLTYTQLADPSTNSGGTATDGIPVEVLRIGTFTDMNGKEVKISRKDLDLFVESFEGGAAGQDVPIDIDHQRGQAGGWIKRIEKTGDKLLAWIDWNELGKQLIGDKIYRYVSAAIDMAGKVIKSVSLVNFPAVKGLKPVELSEGVYTLEQDGVMDQLISKLESLINVLTGTLPKSEPPAAEPSQPEQTQPLTEEVKPMNEQELQELREQIRKEETAKVEAELAERQKTLAELREQARQELEVELKAKYERRQELVKFAEGLTQGDAGLSVKADEVVAFLEDLSAEQLEVGKKLLTARIADFAERGSNGDGTPELPTLPVHARADVISGELTIKELFAHGVIPGKPEDYDLAEFSATQKGF